jgi:hypothetical protein
MIVTAMLVLPESLVLAQVSEEVLTNMGYMM